MTRHIILTGKNGSLRESDANDVDELVAVAVKSQRIVVYFHGGLVKEANGLTTANRLKSEFEKAGAYPIFFVWRSGALEILSTHLLEIAKEDIFDRLMQRVLGWAVGKARDVEGGRGAALKPTPADVRRQLGERRRDSNPDLGVEPFAGETPVRSPVVTKREEADFIAEVQGDVALRQALSGVLAGRRLSQTGGDGSRGPAKANPTPSLFDQAVLEEIAAGDPTDARGASSFFMLAKKAWDVLTAVLARYRAGTDSGIYPTVFEELLRAFYVGGAVGAVWREMKDETFDTFERIGDRGGRIFLDALAKHLPEDGTTQITLVGHSTGAVFIDNLLREVVKRSAPGGQMPLPTETKFQVVLLAPAATSRHFADTIERAEPLVHRCRMFTMDDATERKDRVLGAVYPRSLLYLVSGALETDDKKSALVPLVGLDRYLGAEASAIADSKLGESARLAVTRKYFAAEERMVRSPSDGGADGFGASAEHHGDFDSDLKVLASIRAMVQAW